MDLSYNVVAAKCASQMARYQECVVKNANGDWATICRDAGRALSQCADESVPHLAELKAACVRPIEEYKNCLDTHSSASDEVVEKQCGGLMKNLWECSERAMAEIRARDGKENGAAQGRLV